VSGPLFSTIFELFDFNQLSNAISQDSIVWLDKLRTRSLRALDFARPDSVGEKDP